MGFLNNGTLTKGATPLVIKKGQQFALNFTEVFAKKQEEVQNVSGTASEIVNASFVPATIESQRPFSEYLPGLPLTDLKTMDSTNRYNPAMPLNNILQFKEFLR